VTQDGTDYDNDVDPTLSTEFATAAFRFGHSMIQGLVERFNTDNSGLFDTYLLHDVFFVSDNLKTISTSGQLGMEQILMGLITQPAHSMDKEMTEEITNLLFADGADFGGDLMARNIQRGRDHGIPGFCCYYQLHVDSNFDCDEGWNNKYEGISQDNWNLLRTIHARPSDIDLWTGGLAQDPNNGGLTGEVLQQMKYNAFLKAKNGDRFFFTHKDQAGSFTMQGRQILINRTLAGVICDNTKITFVPENAFELTNPEDFISCDGAPKIDQDDISELLKTE
jgi:peroxidase